MSNFTFGQNVFKSRLLILRQNASAGGKGLIHHSPPIQGIRCGRVVSVGDFETGYPGFDTQSRHYGHGGVPLGKAHFLA